MKKRFLFMLVAIVIIMSVASIFLSLYAVKGGVERLIFERANNRLSIIILGFNATASDVDIYSYVDFDSEVISIKKGAFSVFQYGTARLDLDSPSVKKIERIAGSYDFSLYVDFGVEVANYLNPFRLMIAITAAIYAALFAVSGWLFIGMVVDPIARLAASMSTITSHNLRARVPVGRRKDEIRQLIITFNTMLDEIAETYDRQARFVEDMTHDIVTPVQILEGYRQLIERHGKSPQLIDEFLEVSKVQLGRLMDMTISLKAALAAEKRRHVEFTDASKITARNVVYYRELFPDLIFEAQIEENVILPIDSPDLERIENILIDNAVKYGRNGGRVEVRLHEGELIVRDFGTGIKDSDRTFQRYRRGTEAEKRYQGAGMGLSIVKGFSEEYGFKVELENRVGEGCTFTLRFPKPGKAR
jgi:signal transduction histidine kinase